jgi:hypothetical protein
VLADIARAPTPDLAMLAAAPMKAAIAPSNIATTAVVFRGAKMLPGGVQRRPGCAGCQPVRTAALKARSGRPYEVASRPLAATGRAELGWLAGTSRAGPCASAATASWNPSGWAKQRRNDALPPARAASPLTCVQYARACSSRASAQLPYPIPNPYPIATAKAAWMILPRIACTLLALALDP